MTEVNDRAAAHEGTDELTETNETEEPVGETKLVPVAEAIRYRKRAQAAEQQVDELKAQLETMRGELESTREAQSTIEREREIDRLLFESNAIDVDAVRSLLRDSLDSEDDADPAQVLADLRERKPNLFHSGAVDERAPAPVNPARMGGRASMSVPIESAAKIAKTTGRVQDVVRYLRLRRRNARV